MVQDPTMTNQVMAYQLFREYGITASRTGFASVTVDNFRFGLYLNLEQYDDVSLAWHHPNVKHLFEGQHAGPFPSTPDLLNAGYESKFPVDEGDYNDISDLEKLIYELSNLDLDTDHFSSANGLNDYDLPSVDEVQIGTMMAIEKYMSHWDGYSGTPWWTPNNHYLLSPHGSGFQILPGGADQTFTDWVEPLDTSGATLFKYCMIEITCRAVFHATLADLPGHVAEQDYIGQFRRVFDAHEDSRIADIYQGYSEPDRAYQIGFKATYIDQRVNAIADYVQYKTSSAIYWKPKTLNIQTGTPFTPAHLNAVAAAAGTITYSVNLGSRPTKGVVEVTVHLDPFDPNLEENEYSLNFKVAEKQLITVPAIPAKTLSKNATANKFAIKPTSSSKLAVTATSLTAAVCSVTKLTVQIKKKGKCQIRFSQGGNAKYFAAESVTKYFMVK